MDLYNRPRLYFALAAALVLFAVGVVFFTARGPHREPEPGYEDEDEDEDDGPPSHPPPPPPPPPDPLSDPVSGERVVVSLTTLPPRVPHLRETLRSLAVQTRKPDCVLLCVPLVAERLKARYPMDELNALVRYATEALQLPVQLLIARRDYGPATKLVPALSVVGPKDILVYLDDDGTYPHDLVAGLVAALVRGNGNPATSKRIVANGCGDVYQPQSAKHRIPEGAWGVALYAGSVNASKLREYVTSAPRVCFGCDDFVLAEFFARAGMLVELLEPHRPVKQLGHGFLADALHRADNTPPVQIFRRYGACARSLGDPLVKVW